MRIYGGLPYTCANYEHNHIGCNCMAFAEEVGDTFALDSWVDVHQIHIYILAPDGGADRMSCAECAESTKDNILNYENSIFPTV